MDKAKLVASLGLDTSEFTSNLTSARDLLKTFSKIVKDQVSNLKGYTSGLMESAKQQFALAKSMTLTEVAMKAVSVASKLLKVALISTGIGAIVVALGSLVAYLTTTQAGMDKLAQVTKPVQQIFARLLGVLQNLGGSVFKGISEMINGDLVTGFKTMAQGAKEAGTATVNAFKDGIDAGGRLAKMTVEIEEAENALILTRSRLNREIADAQEMAMNAGLADKERMKYAQQGINLIEERVKAETRVLDMQIEKMKLEQQANDTDRAGYAELNTLIAKREELIATASKQRMRLNNVANIGAKEELKFVRDINSEREKTIKLMEALTVIKNPFDLSPTVKYSEEVLNNIRGISDTLLNPALQNVQGVYIPEEAIERINAGKEAQAQFNKEMGIANSITGALGQSLQATFEAMVTTGKISFKSLIDGIKGLIVKLIAAAGAALALNILLGGIGLGGKAFGGLGGFKDLFSSLAGIPKFAGGGMVTGMTTAILGDNPSGKEAVIPFEKMGSFLSKYGGGGQSGKIEVFGTLTGENIYLSSNNYTQRINKKITG
jgi:hypothetical protein